MSQMEWDCNRTWKEKGPMLFFVKVRIDVSAMVELGQKLQDGLASWYAPQQ